MNKTFRPWQVDQSLLLPPSVHDFVPGDHPSHFVRALVCEELDLNSSCAGLEKVRAEWTLLCTVHNLLKLAKAA